MIVIERWADDAEISRDAIMATLTPGHYRVGQERRIPLADLVDGHLIGISRDAIIYVISGSATFSVETGRGRSSATVTSGDVVTIPAGEYNYQHEGEDDFVSVWAWLLPADFRGTSAAST